MGWNERAAIVERIEARRGSRVICYLTSDRPNADAQVQKDILPLFFEHLNSMGSLEKVDILLYTLGGDTLAAFGLVRLLREFCPRFGVLVPLRCHSAGTLVALGADEVVMTRGATLSPIDPSVSGPLNPAVEFAPGQRQMVPLSVETVASYKDLVAVDWQIQGEEARSAAFRLLAERVHPLALGDVFRARQQIELLATRLLRTHRSDEDNVQRIVTTLTRGLGSHDYLIARTEARELLGGQVAADDPALEGDIWTLFSDFAAEMQLGSPFVQAVAVREAGGQGQAQVFQHLARIETRETRDLCGRELLLREFSVQQAPAAPPLKVVQQETIRSGWTHETRG